MEKKNLDWENLTFSYQPIDKRYVAMYKDGAWQEGELSDDPNVVLNECAGVLQYAQQVFEGLKAYTTKDGHIVCFRPDLNAKRMYDSAQRMEMPPYPKDKFVEAIKEAEYSSDTIVRLYETKNSRTKTTVKFGFDVNEVYLANLSEKPQKKLTVKNNAVTFDIKPCEIVTLLVK